MAWFNFFGKIKPKPTAVVGKEPLFKITEADILKSSFLSGKWNDPLLYEAYQTTTHHVTVKALIEQRVSAITKTLIIPDEWQDIEDSFNISSLADTLAHLFWDGVIIIEVYRTEDGRIAWQKLPFWLFEYDPRQRKLFLRENGQKKETSGLFIFFNVFPPDPTFIYAYPVIQQLKILEEKLIYFLQAFVVPSIVATLKAEGNVDEETLNTKAAELTETLSQLDTHGVVVITDAIEIEPLNTSGSSRDFKEALTYYDEQLSKIILGQTLTSGQGNVGSYALGKVHYQVREDLVRLDRKQLVRNLNAILSVVFKELGRPFSGTLMQNDDLRVRQAIELYQIGFPFSEEEIQKIKEWVLND